MAFAPPPQGKRTGCSSAEKPTGQCAAVIYTLVECAKRPGHNPEVYLADGLERLPAMSNQHGLTVPLPASWQATTAETPRTAIACLV